MSPSAADRAADHVFEREYLSRLAAKIFLLGVLAKIVVQLAMRQFFQYARLHRSHAPPLHRFDPGLREAGEEFG